jgi:sterol desaturase/sphingolipid hydroxylase (fatty acid hydroxylase superfamily)
MRLATAKVKSYMEILETGFARLRRFAVESQFSPFGSVSPQWSRRLFFLDFLVFPLAILVCLALAFTSEEGVSAARLILLFGLGYAAWTLIEYLTHRFVFHHFPVFTKMHLAHHHAPHDLIGTPTIVTLAAFAFLGFWPAYILANLAQAGALSAGLMSGYLAYVSIHYIVHNLGSGGHAWLKRLIRLHAVHHHDMRHNFGVTTAFWDRMFGTLTRR